SRDVGQVEWLRPRRSPGARGLAARRRLAGGILDRASREGCPLDGGGRGTPHSPPPFRDRSNARIRRSQVAAIMARPMQSKVATRLLPEADHARWSRFVSASPDGSIYSTPEYLGVL